MNRDLKIIFLLRSLDFILLPPCVDPQVGVAGQEQEEELLENWIKELEQGIKDMSEVVGPPEETKPAAPVSYSRAEAVKSDFV